ncbi:MAG TPA: hypothetical protein VML75_12680, partial [Kofleriaceae bacterium]|nr:hypothetical protein [Kofleriaceae bacterium]
MSSQRILWLAALVGALAAMPSAASAGDPSQVWKTVETEHFIVSYYEPLGEVGRRVAVVAERAHRILAPALGHTPAGKTHIVVTDETDGSNGFASVLPRNSIRLFATAPVGMSSLNDHDDWLYGLTAHEYTHILHLDAIAGLPKLYNRIFGKTWAPNQVQPRWVIEGIATYEESKRSSSGRTRQALFDMDLRVHTLAGQVLDLDAVSAGPRAWPHGSAAYQYGSHFLKYVFDRYGDDKLREMSLGYGSSPVPWGINRAVQQVTGRTFTELYEEWREYLRAKYTVQLEAVERQGRREGRRLTFSGQSSANPTYTKDGRHLLWKESDGIEREKIRAMPVGGHVGQSVVYDVISRVGDFDVLADGSLVVDIGHRYKSVYDFQDLYLWDRPRRQLRQLTNGLRARDAAVSPDERWVAFSVNAGSRRRLAVMPLRAEAEPEYIWSGGRWDQGVTPAWSPDGRTIAFSAWTMGGYRDILLYDRATKQTRALMHDRAQDTDPAWDPSGRYLYYASDRSGIYNVYAYELSSERTYQVTNVLGCALSPSVSPDGTRMAYTGFDVGGYDLFEIPLDRTRWIEPLPYVNDRPNPVDIRDDEVEVSPPRPYRALETLSPQSYQAELLSNSFGQALTVRTNGSDVAGHHGYSLAATVGLDDPRLSIGMSYGYRRLWPDLRIGLSRNVGRRSGVILDGINTVFTEENLGFTTGVGIPALRTTEGEGTLFLDYDIDWLRNNGDQFDGHDPNEAVPMYPDTDARFAATSLRFNYSDTRRTVHTLGEQEGLSFGGSLRLNHPRLGSDFHTLALQYSFDTFRRLPWLGVTPVVSIRVAGGITTTDRARSNLFVLGGVPEQDIVRSVIESLRANRSSYLRGFPARSIFGTKYHLANLEYRQELWNIERGLQTLPIFVRKLHVAALLDVGEAFND